VNGLIALTGEPERSGRVIRAGSARVHRLHQYAAFYDVMPGGKELLMQRNESRLHLAIMLNWPLLAAGQHVTMIGAWTQRLVSSTVARPTPACARSTCRVGRMPITERAGDMLRSSVYLTSSIGRSHVPEYCPSIGMARCQRQRLRWIDVLVEANRDAGDAPHASRRLHPAPSARLGPVGAPW
jgi:hypothetical protein